MEGLSGDRDLLKQACFLIGITVQELLNQAANGCRIGTSLEDQRHRQSVKAVAAAYKLRRRLIELRLKAGYTQEQMATALKTKKSNISRLENVNSSISPTIKTIERYARAAGYTLDINFIPSKQK